MMCSDEQGGGVVRAEGEYVYTGRRALEESTRSLSYTTQYAGIYFCRLNQLREAIGKRAEHASIVSRWNATPVQRIVELTQNPDQLQVVVGVLFREMTLKPSILKEYASQTGALIPFPPRQPAGRYLRSDEDYVVLEDESARLKLDLSQCEPASWRDSLASGLVVGVIGSHDASSRGRFIARLIFGAGLSPQRSLPTENAENLDDQKWLCLLSGLNFGGSLLNPTALDLLTEFLCGNAGNEQFARRVVRVVLCGNSVAPMGDTGGDAADGASTRVPIDGTGMRQLDAWLGTIGASTHVDVMSGHSDPTNALLPQRPMHRCMFPLTAAHPRVARVANPYGFQLEKVNVLATAGNNVLDYTKYMPDVGDLGDEEQGARNEALLAMELMLRFRHVAPTAPDTLGASPCVEFDPLVIEGAAPNLFCAGNLPSFSTTVVTDDVTGASSRIVGIPDFATTSQAVFVNLSTFDCHAMSFETSSF